MRNLHIMRYVFGSSSSEPISDELHDLYLWIAQSLTGDECELSDDNSAMSLPSVAQLGGSGMNEINNQILDYMRDQWEKPTDVAVVDIARATPSETIRPEWNIGVAAAVAARVAQAGVHNESPLYIVLCRARPTAGDVVWSQLSTALNSGMALILDDAGLIRGQDRFVSMIDRDEYKILLKKARKTAIDILELKLIRRLGHFRVANRLLGSYCTKHYFDGSECKDELAQLIRTFISEQYKTNEKPFVIFCDPESDWLRDVVVSLQDLPAAGSIISLDNFLSNVRGGLIRINVDVQPLLILSVVGTARTLNAILSEWEKEQLPDPKILTVISTHGDNAQMGNWDVTLADKEHRLFYFLRRARMRYQDECPMCRLEIPHQTTGRADAYLSLTSYDFWEMADIAECYPEKKADIPSHRSSPMKAQPPIRQMVHENGPWLARKAIDLIENYLGEGCLKGVPIVHLDEMGAKPLPLYIREISGATLVSVPNWVRNELSDDGADIAKVLERLRYDHPHCYEQLDSVNPNNPVALLEEFTFSGGTRKALTRLMEKLEREVLFHLCVVSFESLKPGSANMKSFSLYNFTLPQE